ncbi:unnamed protein product [Chrysoparadoxa australica]
MWSSRVGSLFISLLSLPPARAAEARITHPFPWQVGRHLPAVFPVQVTIAAESDASELVLLLAVNGTVEGSMPASADAPSVEMKIEQPGVSWLTAHLVDPADGSTLATAEPVAVLVGELHAANGAPLPPFGLLSAVLVLKAEDLDRAAVLVTSLQASRGAFHQVFVVVPDSEMELIEQSLGAKSALDASVIAESSLLPSGRADSQWDGYALQMMLKLLASQLVSTPFYLTLDADVICTASVLSADDLVKHGRGVYSPDANGRAAHPEWWEASEALLGLPSRDNGVATGTGSFGVTPAVINTPGAMLTLGLLRQGPGIEKLIGHWSRDKPESWWTEYTLYRLALDAMAMFDMLHVEDSCLTNPHSVWYEGQLPWSAEAAFEVTGSFFAVVQSRVEGANTADILSQLQQVKMKASREEGNLQWQHVSSL